MFFCMPRWRKYTVRKIYTPIQRVKKYFAGLRLCISPCRIVQLECVRDCHCGRPSLVYFHLTRNFPHVTRKKLASGPLQDGNGGLLPALISGALYRRKWVQAGMQCECRAQKPDKKFGGYDEGIEHQKRRGGGIWLRRRLYCVPYCLLRIHLHHRN